MTKVTFYDAPSANSEKHILKVQEFVSHNHFLEMLKDLRIYCRNAQSARVDSWVEGWDGIWYNWEEPQND